jgi:hypothetical protein
MLSGMYCLLLTSTGLWSFSAFQGFVPGVIYTLVVGAVLLLVNLGFVGSVVWQIARIIDWPGVKERLCIAWAAVAAMCAKVAGCSRRTSKPARTHHDAEVQQL